MTPEEAKRILALYRPGTADRDDPDFAEALDMADPDRPEDQRAVAPDPQLSLWFRQHCAAFQSVRRKFQEIQPPAGLKDQILAEYKSHVTPPRFRRAPAMAAVACALALAVGLTYFFMRQSQFKFTLYRQSMVNQALGYYPMEVQTNDLAAIKAYLQERHAPSRYQLPASLKAAQLVGCALVNWRDRPVTMLCFHTGKPTAPGQPADLWLFVADRDQVAQAPAGAAPVIAQVDKMATASWAQGGTLYVLGLIGSEGDLRVYF